NADNSRRRSVAKADQPPQVTRTKWSLDGGSVAYVESGVRLVVVRVDGTTTTYTLAPEVRADGFRIVDQRFSPNGARVAATETLVFAASAGLWSMTVDGEDLRRETVALDTDSFRLDGQWPGGFLLHRGTNPAQVGFTRSGVVDLPTTGGLIERLSIAADKRS